mmetsp:Transcript_41234/g.89033  ORF Transcript_41234/g.89033 Transcript_41234/m.89033 type:complete len:93 (-) Transcript_41234:660-938(-)
MNLTEEWRGEVCRKKTWVERRATQVAELSSLHLKRQTGKTDLLLLLLSITHMLLASTAAVATETESSAAAEVVRKDGGDSWAAQEASPDVVA